MNDKNGQEMPPAVKEFLAELEDLLEILSQDLIALEEGLEDGREDPELVNSLFRSVHTIKGLAGMLSFEEMGALAHALEDLLDSVRLGRVVLSEEVMDILVKGIEILNSQAKAIGEGVGGVAGLKDFLNRIGKLMDVHRGPSQPAGVGGIRLDEEITGTLTEYEEHRLQENITSGRNLFIIKRSFPFENFDEELNRLLDQLKVEGEVISTLPSSSAEDPSEISFDLLWASSRNLEEASSTFSLGTEDIRKVEGTGEAAEEEDEEPLSSTLRSLSETVRVDIKRLDNLMNIVGELVIHKTQLGEIAREFIARDGMAPATASLNKAVKAVERALGFLQEGVIEARMVPVGQVFGKLNRAVRKLSRDMGKEIEFRISGESTELDKLVVEDMADPLLHLIRNAVDHGVEDPETRERRGKPRRGLISLSAYQRGNHVVIEVEDDGSGIDVEKVRKIGEKRGLLEKRGHYEKQQILSLLFLPAFSTSETVSDVSGRGVGMDVVRNNVSRLRGMIELESDLGQGTRVIITLPMTLAIIQALMVRVALETFAIPVGSVLESLKVTPEQISTVEQREAIRLRESTLPLLRIGELFGMEKNAGQPGGDDRLYVVVVGLAEKRLGLMVDSLEGQREIVIKALGNLLKPVRGIAGATEMGDRRAVLVLDVASLIQEATHSV